MVTIKICSTCGKIFRNKDGHLKQIYCSIECRSKNPVYRDNLSKSQLGKRRGGVGIEHACPICGKKFINSQKHNRVYCSKECRYKDKTEIKKCPICGVQFTSYKYRNTKYCSKECAKKDPEWLAKTLVILRNNTCKKPTRPQTVLLLIIKHLYPNDVVTFENPVDDLRYLIDVAIPRLILGFEYDEPKFHKNNPWKSKTDYDQKRHLEIESIGWNLIHYKTEKELKELVPHDLWCEINGKIKKTDINERCEIIELCSHNVSVEDILNTQLNPEYKHVHTPHNLIEQICPVCDKIFGSERWEHQIYCSRKCSAIDRCRSNKKQQKT